MEGIKNLIIDLGGVLINLTRNRCIEAFENLGVENIREQITNNYQHKDLFERLELGTISVEQFRDDIRALSGKPLTDEQIDTAWIAMLGDVPENKLRLLLELRERYNTASEQYERASLEMVRRYLFLLSRSLCPRFLP